MFKVPGYVHCNDRVVCEVASVGVCVAAGDLVQVVRGRPDVPRPVH